MHYLFLVRIAAAAVKPEPKAQRAILLFFFWLFNVSASAIGIVQDEVLPRLPQRKRGHIEPSTETRRLEQELKMSNTRRRDKKRKIARDLESSKKRDRDRVRGTQWVRYLNCDSLQHSISSAKRSIRTLRLITERPSSRWQWCLLLLPLFNQLFELIVFR